MSDEKSADAAAVAVNASWSSRERRVIWLVGCVLLTVATAWGAYQFQQRGLAPVLIFPLLVGATLGAGLVGLSRFAGLTSARIQAATAVMSGLLTVLGQDYIGYREELTRFDQQTVARQKAVTAGLLKPDDPRLTAPTFSKSMVNRVVNQPVIWPLDLLLTIAASTAVTWFNRTPRKGTESIEST